MQKRCRGVEVPVQVQGGSAVIQHRCCVSVEVQRRCLWCRCRSRGGAEVAGAELLQRWCGGVAECRGGLDLEVQKR